MILSNIITLSINIFSSIMDYRQNTDYQSFLTKYNKSYSDTKYEIFLKHQNFINQYNENNENSFMLEINKFTDINPSNMSYFIKKNECVNCYTGNKESLPQSIDWRKKGAVTHVKNQLECGSCWAFSTTGSIEGALAIHNHNIFNHKIYNLSEQQLVDCSRENKGCQGGIMDKAYEYVINNGICSEESYPYIGINQICRSTNCRKIGKITNYSDVVTNNEIILKRAVAQQPVSVAIQANLTTFRFYKGGVYTDHQCGNELDHGVLIIGYGNDKQSGLDYWLVKNSWSSSWGENGYIRILRNYAESPSGLCGIAIQPSFPIV